MTLRILFGALVAFVSLVADAQTLFTVPDTVPDYASYRYMDECGVAIQRIAKEIEGKGEVWQDTARLDRSRPMLPIPDGAIEAGELCLKKIDVDTVQIRNAHAVASLLLLIGRDDDVVRLYDRAYASLSAKDRPLQYTRMLNVYFRARPMRISIMKELYEKARSEPWATSLPGIIIEMGALVGNALYESGDTAHMYEVGDEVISLNETLSIPDRNFNITRLSPSGNLMRTIHVAKLYRRITERELMDSLSVSTQAYRAYRANALQRVFGDSQAIGYNRPWMRMPEISGDFIFENNPVASSGGVDRQSANYSRLSSANTLSWPVPGRINLIVFLQGGCHVNTINGNRAYARNNGSSGCVFAASALRRLTDMFPQLEVTIVSRTFGSLGNSALLEPEDEADALAKYFLEFHRISATLVVEKTDFVRVSGLDNRRVDVPTLNQENLASRARHKSFIVVDEDGVPFKHGDVLNKESELELEKELEAAISRISR